MNVIGRFVVVVTLLALTSSHRARADEVAPALEGSDLRMLARSELRRLVARLSDDDRRRLAGVYVAFDSSVSDPIAQIACDDDGDDVIVLSDAMLRLAAHVARAQTYDEQNGSRKVEEYASFVARAQTPGRRLLPPPIGFAIAEPPPTTYADRLGDVLAFVVAHELTRLRAGDLVCPNPTATKESGDDVWTSDERRRASELTESTSPGRTLERDAEALVRVRESGRTEQGALAIVRFFAALDGANVPRRFSPAYVTHHPGSSTRLANLMRAIKDLAEPAP